MNREFTSASKSSRFVFAVAAAVSTLLVLGGIDGLAGHYNPAPVQVATSADSPRS